MSYIDKSEEINFRIKKEYIKIKKVRNKMKQEYKKSEELKQKNISMEYREKIMEELNKKSPFKRNRN
jgi:hypothetical protein